jgi:formylglycine-generating enzyme required for sulfatase activity
MDQPIFISFASSDRKAADAICNALERRGMQCWIATRNIGPGENFQEAITRAIRGAKVMILVFSAHANNSLEVKKEIALAGRYNVIVVPVRVEDVVPNDALSYELAVRQWIDMFEDWEQAIERLATQVAGVVAAEPVAASSAEASSSSATGAPPPSRGSWATAGSTTDQRRPASGRRPIMYVAAGVAALLVAGSALAWQFWPTHRPMRPQQTAQTLTVPAAPAAPGNTAGSVSAPQQQQATAPPAAPPNLVPRPPTPNSAPTASQAAAQQPAAAALPAAAPPPIEAMPRGELPRGELPRGELPRGELAERVISALRERRGEFAPGDRAATGEPGATATMPPPEPLQRAAAALQAARGERPGQSFRDCPNCPEMVIVPAGRFEMGSSAAERQRLDVPPRIAEHEQPQHVVTIVKPFALGKFEVTRGEFRTFVRATNFNTPRGCLTRVDGRPTANPELSWETPGFPQTDRDPIVCVNIGEIDAYIEWLRRQTGKPYRLPSEAEWEYAARAGTQTAYYWGDSPDQVCEYENIGDETARGKLNVDFVPMPCRDGFVQTAPVGSFKPNPFGLYDMLGNVFEFTADCWTPNYIGAPTDGSAQTMPGCMMRTIRKGSFGSGQPNSFRAAVRFGEPPGLRRSHLGFRVALTLP